jgi:uncharacterized protein
MKHLCDSNVWIALAIERHPHHRAARRWFEGVGSPDEVVFGRVTQTAFLRLLTQAMAEDYQPASQQRAWDYYDAFLGDDRIGWAPEPEGLELCWRELAGLDTPSPKHWVDAYLAAFATRGGHRLVTFDGAYRRFETAGLDLLLLSAAASAAEPVGVDLI